LANCVACGASNLGLTRTNLVLVDGEWFCQNCLKKSKGRVACSKCGKEAFVSDEHFKTVDGKYLCTDCMEKEGIMKKYDYIMQSVLSLKAKTSPQTTSQAPAGTSSLGGMKEILDQHLSPGETVTLAILGNAGEAIACSQSHLYILKSGMAAGSLNAKKCKKYRWAEIQGLEVKLGSLYGLLEVKGAGLPSFDAKDVTKAKQADNAVTFLVSRRSEFDQAVSTMKAYLR